MRVKFNRTICRAATGAVSPLATVEVRLQSTNALASLYAAVSGGSLLSNPFTADANGFVGFFLETDAYRIITRSSDASESQEIFYEPVCDPDAVDQAQFSAALDLKQDDLGFTPINKAGDSGIGMLEGASFNATSNLKAPVIYTEGGDPINYFKDTNTLGANISGAIYFYDSGDNIIGKAGYFNADGSYEIYNPGRDIKLNSSTVTIAGNASATQLKSTVLNTWGNTAVHIFKDLDTSGANILAVTQYQDSTGANIGTFGFQTTDGAFSMTRASNTFLLASASQTKINDQNGAAVVEGNSGNTNLKRNGNNVLLASGSSVALYDNAASVLLFSDNGNTNLKRAGSDIVAATSSAFSAGIGPAQLAIVADTASGGSIKLYRAGNTGALMPFSATATETTLFKPNSTTPLLYGSSSTTQVFGGGSTNVLLNSTTSITQIFGPSGSPVISADTTTTSINSGNGASKISIPSTGDITSASNLQVNARLKSRYNAGSSPTYTTGQAELNNSASGNPVVLGFHAEGVSAAAIAHLNGGNGIEIHGATFGTLAALKASQFTASSGIVLGNSAQSGTTVLDYYDEQISFTPTAIGGTTAGAATSYTTRSGKGVRVGNIVHAEINIGWTGHTGTGDLLITNLPFTNFSINATASIFADGLIAPAGATMIMAYGLGGNSNIAITAIAATTGVKSNVQIAAAVTNITINLTYQIL